METKINSVDDKLKEIDQNTQTPQSRSLQIEKFCEEAVIGASIRSTADPRENFKSAHFSPSMTSSFSCSDVASRALKRNRNDAAGDGGDGNVTGSVGDRETAPKKKSRAKKMQGLTHEQAELRRSRTNEQERERQRNISEAMEALRKCDMPFNPYLNNKEDSKIYLLKTATAYIYALSRMIDDHDAGLVHHCEHSLALETYGAMQNGAHLLGAVGSYDGCGAPDPHRPMGDSSDMARSHTSAITNKQQEAKADRQTLTTLDEQSYIYHSTEQRTTQNTTRQYPHVRNYNGNELQASQSSLCYPNFMKSIVSSGAEVQLTRPRRSSPSASPFRQLDESLSCLTPQGGNTLLTFNSVVRGNDMDDPSYHSTPVPRGCALAPDTKRSLLCLGNTPATSLGQLPLQKTPTLGKEVTTIDNNNSANSSGYLSMLSAHEDNDSRIFSPERLHQTIDDMYSESFLAPTLSLPY